MTQYLSEHQTQQKAEHLLFDHFASDQVIAGMSLRTAPFFKSKNEDMDRRSSFLKSLNMLPDQVIALKQTHSANVVQVNKSSDLNFSSKKCRLISDMDAVITQDRGVVLTIQTADCIPLSFYDSNTASIGLVHAGWKGLREGIVHKTIKKIKNVFGTNPENLRAFIGPAIRSCCYEFNSTDFPEFSPFYSEVLGKKHLDLMRFLKSQLIENGLSQRKIFDSDLCTSCRDQEFYSYRREGENAGRMLSFLMLK